MEGLLASLPETDDPVMNAWEEGSCVGSDHFQSMLSSGGLEDCDSDNEVSHLLRGGDSLTALRRRAGSGITNSASSRRSRPSTCVSRQSIASRGRPLKPHEGDPFLSVVTCATSARAPHSPNTIGTRNIPLISVEKDDLSTQDLTNGISADCRHDWPAAERATSDRESSSSPCPKPSDTTPRAKDNILVKTPFKHASVKSPKTKTSAAPPGQLLRERTTSATSRVKGQLPKQGREEDKKAGGRLLKGRLKSMHPVNIVWPTLQNCRGIVSDKHSYGPSPSSSHGRRDHVFDSILREYSRRDTEGTESIHHTSVASSETDEKLVEGDLESLSGDAIAQVHKVNSAADVQVLGEQSFPDIAVRNENSDNSADHVEKERPKTACVKSSLKVSNKNSEGRPFSASVAETGSGKASRSVHFADSSKSVHSKTGGTINLNSCCEALLQEIENTHICLPEKYRKYKKEDGVPDDKDFDLDAKNSKVSRNSCKAFNFIQNGEFTDEDSDEEDRFNWKTGQFQGIKSKNGGGTGKNSAESSAHFGLAAFDSQNTNQNCCDGVEGVPCSGDVYSDLREENLANCSCYQRTLHLSVKEGIEKQNSWSSDCSMIDEFVLEKTHVFNFVASQSVNGQGIYASHISAEYNMSPRGRVNSPLSSKPESISPLTFESLEAEISSVQKDIRHFLENNAEMDELETHRDHNLDDLVVNQPPCKVLFDNPREVNDDSLDTSDSEDEKVAVIAVDSADDEIAESLFSRAQYSNTLLSGELIQKQIDAESKQRKMPFRPSSSMKPLAVSSKEGKNDQNMWDCDYSLLASACMAFETDSGCGSEVMSVSHSDESCCHGDSSALDVMNDDEDRMRDKKQPGYCRKGGEETVDRTSWREKDVSSLKVVATTKDLLKLRKGKIGISLSAQHPPLCFRINARPPAGQLYYFAYGTEMNPSRLSTYIQREVEKRFWGVLYGFRVCFNKKGVDTEAGGFPNISMDQESSVEGCLYLLTPKELERLDRCVGYPQHYEHVMFPVWMSNSYDPDNYGVAQYCVPAVMYIAQDNWVEKGSCIQSDYVVNQCLKAADLVTPAYREFLHSNQSGPAQLKEHSCDV